MANTTKALADRNNVPITTIKNNNLENHDKNRLSPLEEDFRNPICQAGGKNLYERTVFPQPATPFSLCRLRLGSFLPLKLEKRNSFLRKRREDKKLPTRFGNPATQAGTCRIYIQQKRPWGNKDVLIVAQGVGWLTRTILEKFLSLS